MNAIETNPLTAAEARTIRRVLASGGDVFLTQGRLNGVDRFGIDRTKAWAVQKVATARLIGRGLLEGTPGFWFPGSYSATQGGRHDNQHRVFATVAGCLALNAYNEKAAK